MDLSISSAWPRSIPSCTISAATESALSYACPFLVDSLEDSCEFERCSGLTRGYARLVHGRLAQFGNGENGEADCEVGMWSKGRTESLERRCDCIFGTRSNDNRFCPFCGGFVEELAKGNKGCAILGRGMLKGELDVGFPLKIGVADALSRRGLTCVETEFRVVGWSLSLLG